MCDLVLMPAVATRTAVRFLGKERDRSCATREIFISCYLSRLPAILHKRDIHQLLPKQAAGYSSQYNVSAM